MAGGTRTQQTEFRVLRASGEFRWCIGTAAASVDGAGKILRISGVTIDVTERKRPKNARISWRARSIIAPAMRSP